MARTRRRRRIRKAGLTTFNLRTIRTRSTPREPERPALERFEGGPWLNQKGTVRFSLFPLDGFGSVVPSSQLHPVFGIDTERVPPNDAMSRFVDFGDKSWDNLKNFFQTQGVEFLFSSQRGFRP